MSVCTVCVQPTVKIAVGGHPLVHHTVLCGKAKGSLLAPAVVLACRLVCYVHWYVVLLGVLHCCWVAGRLRTLQRCISSEAELCNNKLQCKPTIFGGLMNPVMILCGMHSTSATHPAATWI